MSARLRLFKKVGTGLTALNDATEITAISEIGGANEIAYYLVFGAGTNAGAIQVESSHDPAFAGTWAAEGTPSAWSAANKINKVSITSAFSFIRARVSTQITGGIADVWIVVNG